MSMRTILGNFLCNSLDHSYESRTKLVVDISCFAPETWDAVAHDIVLNMARGGGKADWCVTGAGVMFASFGPVLDDADALFDKVYVVVGIRFPEPGGAVQQPPAWLSIQMNIKEQESMREFGVTEDGQWLSDPRHYDHDRTPTPTLTPTLTPTPTLALSTKLHFAESLSEYTKHAIYNSQLFDPSNRYTRRLDVF